MELALAAAALEHRDQQPHKSSAGAPLKRAQQQAASVAAEQDAVEQQHPPQSAAVTGHGSRQRAGSIAGAVDEL